MNLRRSAFWRGSCKGILLVVFVASAAVAQEVPFSPRNSHRDTLYVAGSEPVDLRPLIVPGSERVLLDGVPLADSLYSLDYRNGRLSLPGVADSIAVIAIVSYRTLPFQLRESYFNRRIEPFTQDTTVRFRQVVELEDEDALPRESFFGDSKLERHGSITRGIIAGNNRDVSLESGLRINLSGEVTEGVTVNAVLTDENTPIQPDGTTQRLNEFDRVFIQLETQRGQATLGDYNLRLTGTEFAPLNRKLQGISVSGRIDDAQGSMIGDVSTTVAGAASRGIFNSVGVTPIEGVQGPYRLEGREGERFIIVIAGSERVYLDGQLMTRGETQDYVIDYATGEVTFTTRRIISADRRINIEFEYTTSRFTRSLVGTQSRIGLFQRTDGTSRLKIGTTFLREADSRTFSDELGLSTPDSLALASAGDGTASRSGEELVDFDPEANFTQYVKIDTLFGGQTFTIFVPIADTARADSVYRVQFTRVTAGTGDYSREGRTLNGIVFEWVGPGNGDYIAQRVLPKPKIQRLIDIDASFEPVHGVEVFGEWARSLNDENRLSDLDEQDDSGVAYVAGLRILPLNLRFRETEIGRLRAEVRRRKTGANFEAFDRTKPIEFSRKWNLTRAGSVSGSTSGESEATLESNAEVTFLSASRLRAEWGQLDVGSGFDGSRVSLLAETKEVGAPDLSYRIESINSTDSLTGERGSWLRQFGQVSHQLWRGKLTPGLEIEQERRRQRDLATNVLLSRSESFVEWRPGLTLNLPIATVAAEVEYRSETGLLSGIPSDRAKSWTSRLNLSLRPHKNFVTEADIGYRSKRFSEAFRLEQKVENTETVAVRWTSRARPYKRAIELNWFYEALTERTPLLQETYVRTGTEVGQFVWEDSNEDGIRQIDEFLPERTPFEGTYVRTFIPSDDLQSVINVQARARMMLSPGRVWAKAPGIRGVLSRVSTQTTFEVAEKSRDQDIAQIYLLNLSRFRDSENTLNGRLRLDQRVELFKGEPRYGAKFGYSKIRSLGRLAAGTEERARDALEAEGRVRLSNRFGFKLLGHLTNNKATSSEFSSRTFNIRDRGLEPELAVNLKSMLQFVLRASYSTKADQLGGEAPRSATVFRTPIEIRYNRARRLQVSVRFERANVNLEGDAVGYTAFELTDGRGPGTSFLWNVSGQYTINRLIRSSFFYDGRSPSDAPTIHTIRAQFSLVF